MNDREYDWSAYYRKAWEREKRLNAALAENLAEAEQKQQEMQLRYQKLTESMIFRLLRPAHFLKKAGRFVLYAAKKSEKECVSLEMADAYKEEVECQKNPYAQWIRQEEKQLLCQQEAIMEQALSKQVLPEQSSNKEQREYGSRILTFSYEDFRNIRTLSELPGVSFTENEILLLAENPSCLEEKAGKFAEYYFRMHPDKRIWYAHEDCRNAEGKRCNPWFKPVWSPDTLMGFFYFGSFFAFRSAAARQITFSGQDSFRANVYELCLKMTEKDADDTPAGMTELILYHAEYAGSTETGSRNGERLETTTSEDYADSRAFWGYEKKYTEIKRASLMRRGFRAEVFQTGYPAVWTVSAAPETEPSVSVVIPSKDHPDILERCIRSFLERTDYRNLEFLIVDNGSTEENRGHIEKTLNTIKAEKNVPLHYLYFPMEFNFSRMCNAGAEAAAGEYLLFLNDDIEIIQRDWLKIMVGQAVLPGSGAVGAKLWYPGQERIQHAGITNMQIGPCHKLVTFPEDRFYYFGHNCVPYDMIGVTAACLLIRKKCFQDVNGFEESMAVAYNDVDFCFKLAEHGYRNVQRNDAVLNHHESLSRGLDDGEQKKWERLLGEKEALYAGHPEMKNTDPYYSRYLSGHSPEYVTGYQYPYEDRLLAQSPVRQEGKEQLFSKRNSLLMLTMERAGIQNKYQMEEPEIIMAEGWCYLLNKDNCCYEKELLLLHAEEDWFYRIHAEKRYRYDVEKVLPQQKNVGLSGFVSRVKAEELQQGRYQTGILYRNRMDGREYFQISDKMLILE